MQRCFVEVVGEVGEVGAAELGAAGAVGAVGERQPTRHELRSRDPRPQGHSVVPGSAARLD